MVFEATRPNLINALELISLSGYKGKDPAVVSKLVYAHSHLCNGFALLHDKLLFGDNVPLDTIKEQGGRALALVSHENNFALEGFDVAGSGSGDLHFLAFVE